MDVTQKLYDWWLERFDRLDIESRPARELLGYAETALAPQRLTKDEFIRRLRLPGRDPAVKQRWLNRFVRGHEAELSGFPESVQAFLRDCGSNPPTFLDGQQPRNLREAS